MIEHVATSRQVATWIGRWELFLLLVAAWLVLVSIPLSLGRIGVSWDAQNHQIYLGWVAGQPRFDKDYMAASLQSYQFPYLYWPAYKLAVSGASGTTAGVVLASLHLLAVPPVWLIARALVPAQSLPGIALRTSAVALGFMSAVALKTLETTGNDLLATIPLLWAIALAFQAIAREQAETSAHRNNRTALYAGLLGGVAVACKLSNGPLALLLPCLFLFCRGKPSARMKWMLLNAVAIGVGFAVTYGFWGYQLWLQFGNPVYPFYDSYFEPVRTLLGWSR